MQNKKQQNEPKTKIEILNENEELYKIWVRGFSEKPFDLEKSSTELFKKFYDRFTNGKYPTYLSLAKAVMTSYSNGKKEEIAEFIDMEKLKIENPFEIVKTFFNNYIFKDNKIESNDFNEINEKLFENICEELKKVFGDCIYVDLSKLSFLSRNKDISNDGRNAFLKTLKANGFKQGEGECENLFLAEQKSTYKIPADPTQQKMLLKAYEQVVEDYVQNYPAHVYFDVYLKKTLSKDEFEKVYTIVKAVLENYESRMTKETKNLPEYLNLKSHVDQFYSDTFGKLFQIQHRYSLNENASDCYKTLWDYIKNVAKNTATAEQKEVLDAFYARVLKIYNSVTTKDEYGLTYPANYFACTSILPSDMDKLLTHFSKNISLQPEQAKIIAQVKTFLRMNFVKNGINHAKAYDLDSFLSVYKFRHENNGQVFDLSNEENYGKFKHQVESIITKNNLAKSEICARVIGSELLKGRKNPIKLNLAEKIKN